MATVRLTTPEIRPAADTGLPSNIIAFPMLPPPAEYEPDRQQFEAAYVALCLSWQFAHLDDASMGRAIEELLRRNRCGAATIIQENAAAIRVLYTSTDFLMGSIRGFRSRSGAS